MEEIHATKELPAKQFTKPSSITSAVICKKSGLLAIPGVCDHAQDGDQTRTEYFAKGTVPTKTCDRHIKVTIDKESGHIASPFCPEENLEDIVYLIKDETSPTRDTPYIYPTDERAEPCPLHSEGSVTLPEDETEDEEVPEDDPILPEDDLVATPTPTPPLSQGPTLTPPTTVIPTPSPTPSPSPSPSPTPSPIVTVTPTPEPDEELEDLGDKEDIEDID